MKPTARASARLLLLGCLVTALALTISACGSTGSASPGKATTTTEAAPAPPHKPQASAKPCRAQVGDFLASLETLRRKLEVGLSYDDYVAAVGKARAAYDRLPADRLEIDCLVKAGTPAEKAFNEYIAAANAWGECLSEAGCRAGSIEEQLQGEWRVAAHFLSQAQLDD
jgi:hypothetical protein